MKLITKYQCEYCSKIYDSEISCEKHEHRHKKIEKYCNTIESYDEKELIDSIIGEDVFKNKKIFIDKKFLINDSGKIELYKESFVNAEKFIKYHKNLDGGVNIETTACYCAVPSVSTLINGGPIDIHMNIDKRCSFFFYGKNIKLRDTIEMTYDISSNFLPDDVKSEVIKFKLKSNIRRCSLVLNKITNNLMLNLYSDGYSTPTCIKLKDYGI